MEVALCVYPLKELLRMVQKVFLVFMVIQLKEIVMFLYNVTTYSFKYHFKTVILCGSFS